MDTGTYVTLNNILIVGGFFVIGLFLLWRARRSQAKRGEAPGEAIKASDEQRKH